MVFLSWGCRGAAWGGANSFFIAIESLQFIMNFKTSYVSLAQVVAVQPWVHESSE